MQNVAVYITGSNSKFLSTDVMTEFRGRGEEIHLQPLVFSEFCSAFDGTAHEAWEQYIFYGKSTRRQFEVDFVANRGSERLYIQSALNLESREKTLQEQNNLMRIPDSFKRIIVTEGSMPTWYTEEGTEVVSVEKWLLEAD